MKAMKLFLSYSSKDRSLAEPIYLALRAQKHAIFFDRSNLQPGEEYDIRIRQAIERSDLFVFLVSPDSIRDGGYALTELAIAQKRWDHPGGKVLPVMLRPTELTDLPPYLRAVMVLEPVGNVPASVADEVHRIAGARRRKCFYMIGGGGAAILGLAAAIHFFVPNPFRPTNEITGKDGATGVRVPAGPFVMGDGEDAPQREVYVDSFYIDKHEVNLSRFSKFTNATAPHSASDYWSEKDVATHGELPVIGASWHEADGYCRWAGKRLPTEAEWEKSARGVDQRIYPWGDEQPTPKLANFGKRGDEAFADAVVPVGNHEDGKSPYGVLNLAGNVSEWVTDWYAEGYTIGEVTNPTGPATGMGKVLRGGGWYDIAERLRSTKRFYVSPDDRSGDRGFRCVQDLPK